MESFFWDYRLNAEFPFSVLDYTVTDSLAGGAPRLHWHNYYELGVCTAGEGAFYFEDRRCDYRAGDIFLANDMEHHGAARAPGADTRFRFFLFLPGLLLDGAGERGTEYLLPFRCDPAHSCTHIPGQSEAGRALRPLLDSLWEDALSARSGRQRLIRARLQLILAELCSRMELDEKGRAEGLSGYLRLRPALAYIDAHFTERLTQQEAAAQCFLSESRFRHLFRQEMHMSFQEYVSNLRYLEARRLIASTAMPIAAAVREAGFSNPYYFYKMFQQAEGATPRQWRASLSETSREQPDKI